MTIHIRLGPGVEMALRECARSRGVDPAEYAREIIRSHVHQGGDARLSPLSLEDLVDEEFLADCDREGDDRVTLEEVLQITSRIDDSMARVIIEEERADRL